MKFLGIRNGHDCNVTYTDGRTVRYIKLERTVQLKHYSLDFPVNEQIYDELKSILKKCQEILKINITEVDAVCVNIQSTIPVLGRDIQPNELYFKVNNNNLTFWDQFSCPIYYIDHHYAHALSCWPLTDVSNKNITHFVFDGEGDYRKHFSVFKNCKLIDYSSVVENSNIPDTHLENIGLSILLELIGFNYKLEGNVLDYSGKIMALQSFHTLSNDQINDYMMQIGHFDYKDLLNLLDLFHIDGTKLNNLNKDVLINLAHIAHVFCNDKIPEYFSNFVNNHELITYSGGTAQNTIVNTSLKKQFKNIVIPPHCPDDGISLGCVEFLRQLYNQPVFDNSNFPFWQSDEAPATFPTEQTINKAAELLARGKIIGWYQGQGELGPRALGNRSILMDPSIQNGKDVINNRVKHREPYRPFGASILAEDSDKIFECDFESPYMLYLAQCKERDLYNSITHVDGTCRIQTVNPQHEYYYNLINKFKKLTGIPMLLNTSLNVNGKPIAGRTSDAVELYNTTDLDAVVIGNDIVVK